jgi:lysophospholipase L1-like esterase
LRPFATLPARLGASLLPSLAMLLTLACASVQPVHGEYIVETIAAGGYNVNDIDPLVSARINEGPAFDYAFLMIGINDSIGGSSILPVETFETKIRNMLQRMINHGVTPFVSEIPPVIDSLVIPRHPELTDTPANLIAIYNAAIHRAAAATIPATQVIPMHEYFLPNAHLLADSWIRNPANSGTTDGVHPTIEGSEQIALLYSDYLPIPQYDSKRIVLFGDSITNGQPHGAPWRPGDILFELSNVTAATDWNEYR